MNFMNLFNFSFRINNLAIIYIDALRRDFGTASIIKSVLEQRGLKVLMVSRPTYLKVLKYIRPNIYIICKNFTKDFETEVVQYLKKTKVYILDAEGAMTKERIQFHLDNYMISSLDNILLNTHKAYLWN